ncbi:MAG TPA: malonyl-ACP O-methyltransferase BioC [Azospira sp.]|nr:malonyl-ACP O-methyltransferase BioC [Azospira sp.]
MEKSHIRRAFDRAAASYDQAAALQRQVCDALEAALEANPSDLSAGVLLDAGCGTGYGATLLGRRFPKRPLLLADFAPAMLARARSQTRNPATATEPLALGADLEHLPLAPASVALYWSSLAVQWCDLGRCLKEAARVLAPGGHLAFSTLGPGTFAELAQAFTGIDGHRHVLPFAPPATCGEAMLGAGFQELRVERRKLQVFYPDLRSLLRAIKDIGANQVGGTRRAGFLGKAAWQTVEARYEQHRTAAGLPATYDVVLCTAVK